jgi:hypothetical protein
MEMGPASLGQQRAFVEACRNHQVKICYFGGGGFQARRLILALAAARSPGRGR